MLEDLKHIIRTDYSDNDQRPNVALDSLDDACKFIKSKKFFTP